LLFAIGGALGAMARYGLAMFVLERLPGRFPYGTLIINVTGSFIIGFFMTFLSQRIHFHPNWTLAIVVGFVGAYTTFSTFEFEIFKLIDDGKLTVGIVYLLASLLLGFVAVFGGIKLAGQFKPPAASLSAPTAAGSVISINKN
jgi:CrcB protein